MAEAQEPKLNCTSTCKIYFTGCKAWQKVGMYYPITVEGRTVASLSHVILLIQNLQAPSNPDDMAQSPCKMLPPRGTCKIHGKVQLIDV